MVSGNKDEVISGMRDDCDLIIEIDLEKAF